MKVLVTGGGGFIGSHTTENLLAKGHEVLVIDDYSTGRRDNLKPHERLQIMEGTIADGAFVRAQFEAFQPTHVVHAAASYKDPNDWENDTLVNALGTANVVQAAVAGKVERLVYFQTALCYGNFPKEQPVTLSHPRYPDCSYAISKTAGEEYIEMSGLDYVTFRLANIVGPRNISGAVPVFYSRLSAGKACFASKTRRDFVYVQDLVDVVLLALSGKGESGTYHASTGSDCAIKEIYDLVAAELGVSDEPEIREPGPDDALTILLDPSKTKEQFGWEATTPMATSVKRAVAYYREYGLTETYTHLKHED